MQVFKSTFSIKSQKTIHGLGWRVIIKGGKIIIQSSIFENGNFVVDNQWPVVSSQSSNYVLYVSSIIPTDHTSYMFTPIFLKV